ncbi:MAG: DUF5696 domain-containing protein, partial [Ruminococcus sp.]|nr:DUF5696 domain-containing protein [Ruminococcus sp.]
MSKVKSALWLLLVAAVALTFFGCSGKNKADAVELRGEKAKVTVSAENKSKALYVSNKKRGELKKIASSDISVMYFDESNYTVSVYDSISKQLWNSLPEKYSDGKPSAVSVDIMVDGNAYTLNSQDDSVAEKNAAFEAKDSNLLVTYGFKKTLDDGTKISFKIPVNYSVDGSTLTASVDCSKIKNDDMSENVIIKTVHLLNYFGADTAAKSGDFILIPDGCGAKIDTAKKVKQFKKISIPVYSADYSVGENAVSSFARVASFAMKSGSGAYIALIESGDAIAKITAEKAIGKSAYNRVGASFDITPVMTDKERKISHASAKSYDGEIKVSYRFLSGDNSDYVAMASACREMLIRNGTLNFTSADDSNGMPFLLGLAGAAEIGDEKPKLTSLTTFEQAADILSVLRSKGIDNINLRYKGMLDGGLSQVDITKADVSSQLGSDSQFAQFVAYTDAQNISLFADVNLITAKSLGRTATRLDSTSVSGDVTYLKGSAISSAGKSELLAVSEMESTANAMLSKMRSLSVDGICFADAGNVLYSDFTSGNAANRQQVKEIVSAQVNAASSSKKLMVDGGNLYSVKYAEMIDNL